MYAHPCGQAVDWIWYCYRLQMRTGSGVEPVQVQWFPAQKGAKLLNVPTPFHSRWNDEEQDNDGLGEQWPAGFTRIRRKYKYGLCFPETVPCYRPPACYDGLSRCGSDRVWSEGGILGRDPLFDLDDVGRPECCPLPVGCHQVVIPIGFACEVDQMPTQCFPLGCRYAVNLPVGFALRNNHLSGEQHGVDLPIGFALENEKAEPPFVVSSTGGSHTLGVLANLAPAGMVAGDLILIFNYALNATSIIPPTPAGFTVLASGQAASGIPLYKISYKTATGSEPANYVVTLGAAHPCGYVVVAVRNWDGAAPAIGTADGVGSTLSAPSQTAVSIGELLLAAYSVGSAGGVWTDPTGMTLQQETAPANHGRLYRETLSALGATGLRDAATTLVGTNWFAASLLISY